MAGTLLAWRLAQCREIERVDLLLDEYTRQDASLASDDVVRAYEPQPELRRLAVESLTELRGSRVLRDWCEYRETGSLYLRSDDPGLVMDLGKIEAALPRSATVLSSAELAALGWGELPYGTVGLFERFAGNVSPSLLRDAVVTDLTMRQSAVLTAVSATAVTPGPGETVNCIVGGRRRQYDAAVLAAGAWTPRMLVANGFVPDGLRTKSIRHTVYDASGWRPPPFVDDTTGLHGVPTIDGRMLLSMSRQRWSVATGREPVTSGGRDEMRQLATLRLPHLRLGAAVRSVDASDRHCDPSGLSLRPVRGGEGRVWTFTGGSGCSVQMALAASRQAAERLVGAATRDHVPAEPCGDGRTHALA